MNKEELLIVFSDIFKENDVIKAKGFIEENHKPHQFMVGHNHQEAASKENNGVLTEEICQKIPCEQPYCDLSYEEHTCDKTLILQLTRDATQSEVRDELIKAKETMLDNGVQRVGFADTEEKFIFLEDEEA